MIEANTASADIVLKNSTGQRNIRLLAPGILSFGDVSDPSLYVANTSITARKSLSVQGAFSVTGTRYAPPPWIGGITAGLIHATNVANINLISTAAAAANSEIEFGYTTSGG